MVTACIAVSPKNTGTRCESYVTSITLVNPKPIATPTRVDAVNYETDLPWMSAILLAFANLRLILALEAEESIKQMFLATFAREAINKKYCGKAKVVISIQKERLRTAMLKNRHFFMSASKF